MKKTLLKISLFFASLCTAFLLLVSCSPLKSNFKNKTYYVSNDYFATATCNQTVTTTVSLQGGGVTESPQYSISTQCTVPLYQYEAEVLFYSATNKLLESKHFFKSQKIDTGKTISFTVDPNEHTIKDTVFVRVIFEGRSNEKPGSNSYGHTIVFFKNNGEKPTIKRVRDGETLCSPADPKKDNSFFDGWFSNENLTSKFSFSSPVMSDIALYAKYSIDAAAIANRVSTEAMRGVVKIYNKCYSTTSRGTEGIEKQGSGFCFLKLYSYIYILTNNHVVEKSADYKSQEITVVDYQGNEYPAYIYSNSLHHGKAVSSEYDLACIYIELRDISTSSIRELNFADSNPRINEDVISIGSPESQANFFTFGKVLNYKKPNLVSTPSINIPFEVVVHDAPTNHGSSGGPLLNANLEVIGINFASSMSSDYTFTDDYSLSIPIEKIQEFVGYYIPQ